MRLVCAWCQHEGRPGLMREDDSSGEAFDSHAICDDHSIRLLREIRLRFRQGLPLSLRTESASVAIGAMSGR